MIFLMHALANKHIYFGNASKDIYYRSEVLEPKFKESRAERTKLRRQKKPDEKRLRKKDKSVNKDSISKCFKFQSLFDTQNHLR